jgi:hypothetical protein
MECRGLALFSEEPAIEFYLSQFNPEHIFNLCSCKIYFNVTFYDFYLIVGLLSCIFPLSFLSKILCAFLISPKHVICPLNLMLLDLIILAIVREEYRLWNVWVFIVYHSQSPIHQGMIWDYILSKKMWLQHWSYSIHCRAMDFSRCTEIVTCGPPISLMVPMKEDFIISS